MALNAAGTMLCNTLSNDVHGVRDKLCGFGTAMVDNHEHGIEAVRLR